MIFRPGFFSRAVLWGIALLLALPVLVVIGAWLQWNEGSSDLLRNMLDTVLLRYAGTTVALSLGVGIGVVLLGTLCAVLVSLFDFPGRRTFEWALLLPLAMPAYVLAYAYTDFLQFSGPLQTWMRSVWGLEGRLLPNIRSVGGAIGVFILALYPYVYLLVRTALAQRAQLLMEAARLLGASLGRRVFRVALPMARPAMAAGAALALMETLADYGVSSYFGIQTFTAGIYKAWLVMEDHIAAAQLATVLLLIVALLLMLEQRSQARLRFASQRLDRASAGSASLRLNGWRAALVIALCALPVLLGFVLPVGFMLRALHAAGEVALPWARFGRWAFDSLALGLGTAVLASLLALWLSAQSRLYPGTQMRSLSYVIGLGYAVPGAVIVVGLLLPVGWVQSRWPQWSVGSLLTTTFLGLIWAYLVRFVAVALQSVQSGYSRVPVHLDDSARMLGVAGWGLLRRVHMPLLRQPMMAAILLVMVDVMKELPATLVLRPFNTDTLAVITHQLARDERLGEAALPALALVLVGLVPVIMLSRTLRRR